MASAPVVARPPHHDLATTSSFLSTSTPFVGALLKPAEGLHAEPYTHDRFNTTYSNRYNDRGEATSAAAKVIFEHSRLHKRGSRSSRRSSQNSQNTTRTNTSYAGAHRSSVINEEITPLTESESVKSSRIKQNIRKTFQTTEQDTSIDLSRTAEENEQRSGLVISSPTSNSPSLNDTNFTRNIRNRQHARTYSSNSTHSSTSGSFKPTEPYMHPLRQSSISQKASPLVIEDSGSAYFANTDNDLYKSTPGYSTSRSHGMGPGTLNSPIPRTSASTTSVHHASPAASQFPHNRSRRNTNQSGSASGTPSVLSFIRGNSYESQPVDDATRAASILAAREAFNEREAAKQAKYERKEQKQRRREEELQNKGRSSRKSSKTNSEPGIGQARAVTFIRDGDHQRRSSKGYPRRIWKWAKGSLISS